MRPGEKRSGDATAPRLTRATGPIQPRFTASTKKKTTPRSVTMPPAQASTFAEKRSAKVSPLHHGGSFGVGGGAGGRGGEGGGLGAATGGGAGAGARARGGWGGGRAARGRRRGGGPRAPSRERGGDGQSPRPCAAARQWALG